jgi:hypothetical protein
VVSLFLHNIQQTRDRDDELGTCFRLVTSNRAITPQNLVDLAASQQETITLDEARAMMGDDRSQWTQTDFRQLLSSESSSNAVLNRIREEEEEEDDDEEMI